MFNLKSKDFDLFTLLSSVSFFIIALVTLFNNQSSQFIGWIIISIVFALISIFRSKSKN